MKRTLTLLAALLLTGCAGLDVTWNFQASYMSEAYLAKQQEGKRLEDIRRMQQP